MAYTRGTHGSLLCSRKGLCEYPGKEVQVRDTVGAGDAYTAALVLGLLLGRDADSVNRTANEVAAHVCSCEGALPLLPPRILSVARMTPACPSTGRAFREPSTPCFRWRTSKAIYRGFPR